MAKDKLLCNTKFKGLLTCDAITEQMTRLIQKVSTSELTQSGAQFQEKQEPKF